MPVVLTYYSEDYQCCTVLVMYWQSFFSSTFFFSKQILILCLSTFVLKQHIWKRILTFSGCQKLAWLKTLSRSLKNTSKLGDCWYAEILLRFQYFLYVEDQSWDLWLHQKFYSINTFLYVSQPLRICILGPPAVGKSTIAERICKHYKLHHVKLKETITETLENLVSVVQHPEFIHNHQSMFI